MSVSVEEPASQAIVLADEDRARLADLLTASLPDVDDHEVDAAWDEEIQRRVAGTRTGSAQSMPAWEVHTQARQIYTR